MAKSKSNDNTVLELKKQVEEKKASLSASKTFNPKTNCSLLIGAERINIRAESKDRLVEALVHVNSLKLSAESLNLLDEYKLSGFKVQEWISDIQCRLAQLDRKKEEERLKVLEDRLHSLLSVDKKVELEIEDLKRQI